MYVYNLNICLAVTIEHFLFFFFGTGVLVVSFSIVRRSLFPERFIAVVCVCIYAMQSKCQPHANMPLLPFMQNMMSVM